MEKYLIVDDHAIMRKGIKQVLSDMGINDFIFEAEDGESAVSMAISEQPEFIVMDIGLKSEDGIDVSRRILDILPETKIIILTIHATINFIQRALEAGVKGYVLKDSMYEELMIAINKVKRGKTYLCENSFEIYNRYKNALSDDPMSVLTSHEKEILRLIVKGNSLKNIATQLIISEKTVSTHKSNIMKKLELKNYPELIIFASKNNLI